MSISRLWGADQRTTAAKRQNIAAAGLIGTALGYGGGYFSPRMGASGARYGGPMRLRRYTARLSRRRPRRSVRRPRYRRGYRRLRRARGGLRRAAPSTGVTPVNKLSRRRYGRGINTNCARNSNDSFRLRHGYVGIEPNTVNNKISTYSISLKDIADSYSWVPDEIVKFQHYKVVNVQWIIYPLKMWQGAAVCRTDGGADPYFYVSQPVESDLAPSSMTDGEFADLVATPGYRRIRLDMKRPVVINATPMGIIQDTMSDKIKAVSIVQERYKKLSWMDVPDTTTPLTTNNYLDFARIRMVFPRMTVGTEIPTFGVQMWATILLNGRRALVELAN